MNSSVLRITTYIWDSSCLVNWLLLFEIHMHYISEHEVKCEGDTIEVTLPTKGNHEFKYLLDATAGRKNNFFKSYLILA